MPLPNFLKLFTGVKMSSIEFEKLKNKIEVAKATIVHQNALIAEKNGQLDQLQAEVNGLRAASPAAGEADYAELSKGLDEVFAVTDSLRPAATEPTALAVDAAAFAPAATTPGSPSGDAKLAEPAPATVSAPTDVSYPGSDHPRNEA